MPTLSECIDLHIRCGKQTNADITCVGISVNTSGLPEDQRKTYLRNLSEQTGLLCVDSVIDGCDQIADFLVAKFDSQKSSEESYQHA